MQLAAAVRAVAIRSPASYVWLGRPGPRLPPAIASDLNDAERRHHLVATLRDELYGSFDCHGRPAHTPSAVSVPVAADPALAEALAAANAGRGRWESGWRVEALDGGEAVVTSSRLRVRLAVKDCRGAVRAGGEVAVRVPNSLPALSPGFHTLVSDAPDPSGPGVRIYWHVNTAGAPALVRALTATLNGAGVPFRLKVADHPLRFDRCDAAVMYLPLAAFADMRAELTRVAAGLDGGLRDRVPAFTLRVAPGLGVAEDDGAGDSFGLRRCAVLADALVLAREHGISRLAERVDTIAARFAADGVRVDAPYLEPALDGRHVL